jgi:hypothetical protein
MAKEGKAKRSLATTRRELEAMSTDELERRMAAGSFDFNRKLEVERILRERYAEPDRRIALWTLIIAGVSALAAITAAIIAYFKP